MNNKLHQQGTKVEGLNRRNSHTKNKPRSPKNFEWQILSSKKKLELDEIVDILLTNRGLKTAKEKRDFLNPKSSYELTLKEAGLRPSQVKKALARIKRAIDNKEKVIVYGDYDADGVCATGILWEVLYTLGARVIPHIPNRFSEGYGLNPESVEKLKAENPELTLIITVDNGVVAEKGGDKARELGIDLIITDHHEKGERYPHAYSVVHTNELGGAGIAFIMAREIAKSFKSKKFDIRGRGSLELAAIGTIADQMPLLGPNRSIAKYGLMELNKTDRVGLNALMENAAIKKGDLGTYHINFVIAPRINAMGRLENALDSLRLLCTNDPHRGRELAALLAKTNLERQRIVEEMVSHARERVLSQKLEVLISLAHESYHEGIIGLVASRLTEEFYRPAIVIAKGKKYSKASARSVAGFNIIENIRKAGEFLVNGGGHPMAAGFTIETKRISTFTKSLLKISTPLLTESVLTKKLRADLEMDFSQMTPSLLRTIKEFEPFGVGNPAPVFVCQDVGIVDARIVGSDKRHLKLTVEKGGVILEAIGFGMGNLFDQITSKSSLDLLFSLEENKWNGNTTLQLKLKDLKIKN